LELAGNLKVAKSKANQCRFFRFKFDADFFIRSITFYYNVNMYVSFLNCFLKKRINWERKSNLNVRFVHMNKPPHQSPGHIRIFMEVNCSHPG